MTIPVSHDRGLAERIAAEFMSAGPAQFDPLTAALILQAIIAVIAQLVQAWRACKKAPEDSVATVGRMGRLTRVAVRLAFRRHLPAHLRRHGAALAAATARVYGALPPAEAARVFAAVPQS